MKSFVFIILSLFLFGCSPLRQVSIRTSIEDEARPNDNREGVLVGAEAKLENDMKFDAAYRNRLVFGEGKMEHGFLFGITIPVWTKGR